MKKKRILFLSIAICLSIIFTACAKVGTSNEGDRLVGLTLSIPKDAVQVGKTVKVTVKEVWEIAGEKPAEDISTIAFVSSDEKVAVVDENGVIKGLSASQIPVTISATVKDSDPAITNSATIQVTSILNAVQETYEYKFTMEAFNVDKMMGVGDLDENGPDMYDNEYYYRDLSKKPHNLAKDARFMIMNAALADPDIIIPKDYYGPGNPTEDFYAMDTDLSDGKGTHPWRYLSDNTMDGFQLTDADKFHPYTDINDYGQGADTPFTAFAIDIPATGQYMLKIDAGRWSTGGAPAVYFYEYDGTIPEDATVIEKENCIGYFDTSDSSKVGYELVDCVNVEEPGEYVVAFVYDSYSKELSSNILKNKGQCTRIAGIKLEPLSEDICIGVNADAEVPFVYVGSTLQLNVYEIMQITGETAVEDIANFSFESSDESCITIDENAVMEAHKASEKPVTITVTKKDSSPAITDTYKIMSYEPGQMIYGLELNYLVATKAMKDQTVYVPHENRLDMNGDLRDLSYVDSYEEISRKISSQWAYSNMENVSYNCLRSEYMELLTELDDCEKGSFFAIKVNVPAPGEYNMDVLTQYSEYGSSADIYLVSAKDDSAATLALATKENYIGSADATNPTMISRLNPIGEYVNIPEAGDYYVILKLDSDNPNVNYEGKHIFKFKGLTLSSRPGEFAFVDIDIDGITEEGETLPYKASRKLSYEISDVLGVQVENFSEKDLLVNSIKVTKGGDLVSLVEKDNALYVETPASDCEATITADMTYKGVGVVTDFTFKVADIGKTGRTIYSDEMIANARENIEKYEWAKTDKDIAVRISGLFLDLGLDMLWDSVTSQDLVRAYNVGIKDDPDKYICRYCRANIGSVYGNYPYKVDITKNPWKITCPTCSKSFPSNDFASFYELGRTQENEGKFDRLTALQAHREMLIMQGLLSDEAVAMEGPGEDGSTEWYTYYGYGVEGGYLHNDLYPEVGSASCSVRFNSATETVERWGVDDGMGYRTGSKYSNGVEEIHTYIAYYNHFGTFMSASGEQSLVRRGLVNLAQAYIYTGEEKYGIAGAIILDRLADNYPEYDVGVYCPKYPNNNGGTPAGKSVGRIWESILMDEVAEAYDMLYPIFENEQVISFLNKKATYYCMENDKSSATKIRQNIEDGILREIYSACETSKIKGNFGLHQSTLATAAVALDSKEDTAKMLDWLYAISDSDHTSYNTGGDINRMLVDMIYRDGANLESPYYNEMGISNFIDAGIRLDQYKKNGGELNQISIFEHPKYLQMINSYQQMFVLRRGVQPTGDAYKAMTYTAIPSSTALISAFYYTKDSADSEIIEENVKMAQHLYLVYGDTIDQMHYDIYSKNPEGFVDDVREVVEKYGEYDYDKSSIMTGYGFAYLRDGILREGENAEGLTDTTRDFMLNFSPHTKHNHADFLDIEIDAFGIGMTTDLGYPETPVTNDPHTIQWSQATISHNTVVVDEKNQGTPKAMQEPLHFDAKDTRVKVADARTPDAYGDCEEYRRTVVMIDYNDDVSYGVDFFHVTGGNDHLWTFSANSEVRPIVSDNLEGKFVSQVDEVGEYVGSYAGAEVSHGNDPGYEVNRSNEEIMYPLGYTWMYDVDRADNPGISEFTLDYEIQDFKKLSRNEDLDIRMSVTMLNDFAADEISLVSTTPQRIAENRMIDHLEKILVRRKGENLDSLFTTVYEPYIVGEKYIQSIASTETKKGLKVKVKDGTMEEGDVVKAVKVVLADGRTDYIVYATNKNVTYKITDRKTGYKFEFRGFVGVWSINEKGQNIYSYLHDGDILGKGKEKIDGVSASLTGKVIDFQKELSLDNWIEVEFDRDLTEEEKETLVDRMINVERTSAGNSSYLIMGATFKDDRKVRIDLGSTSTIANFVDAYDESKGFVYDLEEGKEFEIPISYEYQR